MKKLAMLVLFLVPFAQNAGAATITFQADYTTLYYQLCQGHAGCFDLPLSPFSKTFTLDSSQLAVDGVYDVASWPPILSWVGHHRLPSESTQFSSCRCPSRPPRFCSAPDFSRFWPVDGYSWRSARSGSVRLARSAGRKLANSAAPTINGRMATKVNGSVACTPATNRSSSCPAAIAAIVPRVIPASTIPML